MFPMLADWVTLCATVFALGLRHGLDADHLAAIDCMTRFNHGACPPMARWCGMLFSAGHGAVVVLVATTAGPVLSFCAPPAWLIDFTQWTAIGVLLALGALNLRQVMSTSAGHSEVPFGARARLFVRLTRTANPIGIAAVGGLFALSFDTISQALLFSATAVRFHGWMSALILGALFTLGMMLLDGINAAWMARLLDRADETARSVSRVLGSTIAVLSLLVGVTGGLRLLVPHHLQATPDSQALPYSLSLIAVTAIAAIVLAVRHPRSSGRRPRMNVPMPLRAGLLDLDRDGSKLTVPDAALGDH
jgi:nickel/cobalt transporter (NiCoT) family protein